MAEIFFKIAPKIVEVLLSHRKCGKSCRFIDDDEIIIFINDPLTRPKWILRTYESPISWFEIFHPSGGLNNTVSRNRGSIHVNSSHLDSFTPFRLWNMRSCAREKNSQWLTPALKDIDDVSPRKKSFVQTSFVN
jgi:hypothetical protein